MNAVGGYEAVLHPGTKKIFEVGLKREECEKGDGCEAVSHLGAKKEIRAPRARRHILLFSGLKKGQRGNLKLKKCFFLLVYKRLRSFFFGAWHNYK